MEAAVTNAPAGKSWRLLVLGLIAFLLIPRLFELWIPLIDPTILLIPIIAVCGLVGWLSGGNAIIALVWLGLAIPFLAIPGGGSGNGYDSMARGWALILAGSFGLVSLWNSSTAFFVRALEAVTLAVAAGFVLAISSPGGTDRFERVATQEYTRRSKEALAGLDAPLYRSVAAASAANAKAADMTKDLVLSSPPKSAALVPAMLALESLAAMALGWAVYQRVSAQRIGPDLSPLRVFTFNDQLVWGVAVGATLLMLPAFEEGRNAGLNLLIFFGSLYLLRGFGVLAWMTDGYRKLIVTMFAVALILSVFAPSVGLSLLGVMISFSLGGAIVLGLGDTWLDWRRRPTAG